MKKPASSLWLQLALVLLAVAEIYFIGGLSRLEHAFQDALLRVHARRQSPDPDVVLVKIDERSLDALKENKDFGHFPWPRSVYGEFIEKLVQQRPAAIVLDIQFAEPDLARPQADLYFVETVAATPQVFVPLVRLLGADDRQGLPLAEHGERFGFTRTARAKDDARLALLLPFNGIAETGRIGAINFLEDEDGVGRRCHVYLEHEGWRIPSLPARVAQSLGYSVPEQASIELNWHGRPRERSQVSFSDLFLDLGRAQPRRPTEEFRDKIVIVGAAASGLSDLRATPIMSLHLGADIVATAIENLKRGDWLRRPPAKLNFLLCALGVASVGLAFYLGGGPMRTGLALLIATPVAVAGAVGALQARWLLPMATPLVFTWACYVLLSLAEYLRERASRRHAVQMFGRFVDPRVVRELVQRDTTLLQSRGESRVITLLFSDIRGFTSMSESRPPEEIVGILNRYFTRQVEVIFRHHGTVDKFIGDAIMAFWGAPVEDSRQALNAVSAALEMARVVLEFRAELGEAGREFDIGIGLHTGPAVVGFIGSENKLDYTAIGDTVNLASRIEGATKGVARILVSEATRRACGNAFTFTEHGSFKVKGREQEVRLFEPVERNE